MKNILIIGATSTIAEECARLWAAQNHKLFLIARKQERLESIQQDLLIRGAEDVQTHCIDLRDMEQHRSLLEHVDQVMKNIDIILIAHGTLSDQKACQNSPEQTLEEISINALSTISLLTLLSNKLETQKHGTIAVISSVAGDRGRESNYVYGASKAAVTTFLSGLRQRLFKSNVHVLTIKPGFVRTAMTKDLDLPKALTSEASAVAHKILEAINKKKNTVYIKSIWWPIMLIIRLIPDTIFKRISL